MTDETQHGTHDLADHLADEAVNEELTRRIDELANLVLEAEAALGEVLEVVQRQSSRTEDTAAEAPVSEATVSKD
ncbi:hypothetical protein ACFVT5_02145 [Streptomyces sp. NPDC058001]|uniref:hypothetical protein n=1 Tax=Streptomyces sp. NPDC058001 TaxID=3346300 RepID=UPI0036EB35EE